jgi:hypothetical protein
MPEHATRRAGHPVLPPSPQASRYSIDALQHLSKYTPMNLAKRLLANGEPNWINRIDVWEAITGLYVLVCYSTFHLYRNALPSNAERIVIMTISCGLFFGFKHFAHRVSD